MHKRHEFSLSLLLAFSLTSVTSFAAGIDLQTFRTHSRLSLPLDSSTETTWKEIPGGFTLTLKGVELQDLTLGSDFSETIKDNRIKSLSAHEEDGNVVIRGTWNFPEGNQAPADPSMERFEYREKSPSRFVVDFWPKTGPSLGDLKKMRADSDRKLAIKKAEVDAKKRKETRKTLEKTLALQEDVGRFCQEPLKSEVDIFLPFYPLHETFEFAKYFPQGYPDQTYQYLTPARDSPDAKFVNLALDLHAKGSDALVIKTIDLFEKERKNSLFQIDMKFLRANALLKLGHQVAAEELLNEIRDRYVGSPASLHAALYLSHQYRLEANHLKALDGYLWLAQRYPDHRLNWVFRLAAAESLYSLKQTDRAAKEYEWVSENAPTSEARAQAALRLGDVYMVRFQYDRALAAYFKASEDFQKQSSLFPSLQINRAEALYWLGQLDRAEEAFVKFLDQNPGHPAGWRATVRLAEVEGKKVGPTAIAQSRKYFLKTINSYPFSPGATLARMRLIPCGDHAGFTAATAREFFEKEAQTFNGNGEIVLNNFKELRSILRVRSLILFDETTAALDAAIQEKTDLSRKSTSAKWLSEMERQLFRKSILSLLDQGKKFDAIQFYDQRSDKVSFIDPSDEIESGGVAVDPDYILRLSRAASDLGLGTMASKINAQYAKASAQYAIKRGIASQTQINTFDIDARLKKSERTYTEAKALWVSDRTKNATPIRELLAQVVDESPFSFEREIMLGILDEAVSKQASALQHATRARMLISQGNTSYTADVAVVDQWIADLQAATGIGRASIETYRKLSSSKIEGEPGIPVQLGLKSLKGRENWIIAEGEQLAKLGRWGEAASVYEKAVNDGVGGNRAMYEYANALSKTQTNERKVQTLLKKLAESETEDFWRELARKAITGQNAKEGNLK
jgi:tetratricopeptide (TPR) repeat protein